MFTNTLPIPFTIGIAGVLETCVSYSYGNKNYHQCGQYLYKSILVLTMAFIPIGILILSSKSILIGVFDQNEEASALAAKYLLIALPGLYF